MKFTATASLIALYATSSALLVTAQPYADCDLDTYYSSLPAAISSPLNAARNDMHTLIRNTHRNQLPYTSAKADVWDALIALDSDASGQNVKLVYADIFVAATPYDSGNCTKWNREHLWSRSLGVGSSGKDNTDLHHLRPSDCNVNAARSNLYFGACGTGAPAAGCTKPRACVTGTPAAGCTEPTGGAYKEAAYDTQKDSVSFLPPAARRGDVARAILYMDLRYDGDERGTLDLVVSDCPETVPDGAGIGYLSQLLKWHLEDPPDAEEIQRNGEVCADWQGNRNPFIDYPQLASIYHGGSRPLLGDGLGYDCTVPPPPAGPDVCSDDSSQSCSTVDQVVNLSKLMITGVIDGPLPNGLPKAIELYALDDIADLSTYGIGSANNGGGTDNQEFILSGSVAAGSFITIAYEATEFGNYFGVAPTYISGVANINGDDAIELFFDGLVADTFGDIGVDGTRQAWEYMDGWAYRNMGSIPGGSFFQLGEWSFSGANAVDGCVDNASCGSSFPFKSFGGVSATPDPTN